MKKVKDLKRGEYFKLKETSSTVWVRDEYCREVKEYFCYKFEDVNHLKYIKGDKEVFIEFEF